MQTFELRELSNSRCDLERKLSQQEMYNITGGGIASWVLKVVRDGVAYDAAKSAANWTKENLPVGIQADQVLRQYDINPTIYQGVDITGAASNIA